MSFDPELPCRARNGNPVKILATGLNCCQPIAAVIKTPDGDLLGGFNANGRYFPSENESENDLFNIPQPTPSMNPTNKPFDPTKPVQTRDGRKARVLIADLKQCQPIVAAITVKEGIELLLTFSVDGLHDSIGLKGLIDLVNIHTKVKVEFWVNVYPSFVSEFTFQSKKEADRDSHSSRIACLHIHQEVTEGDGL